MEASRWIAEERRFLERELREAGLDRLAAQLARTAAPAGRLFAEDPDQLVPGSRRPHAPSLSEKLESSGRAFGRTRLGGVPDVHAGFEWPTRQRSRKQYGARIEAGDPLSFVAQVNLSEAPRVVLEAGAALPQSGMLWFFYDAENLSFGGPDDADGFRVSYENVAVEDLSPAAVPDGLDEEYGVFDVVPLLLAPELALPSGETEALEALGFWSRGFPDEEFEAYHELVEERNARAAGLETRVEGILPRAPAHRLLGYPNVIQGAMEPECQLASRGQDGESYWAPIRAGEDPPPNVQETVGAAADWRLLLQLDSDPAANMMWGDAGMLYYWIEEDALKKREFHRAWNIMQCY